MSTIYYNKNTLKNLITDYYPQLKLNEILFNKIYSDLCQDFDEIGQSNSVILIQNIQYLIVKYSQ